MVHIYEKLGKFNDSEMLGAFPMFISKFTLMGYEFSLCDTFQETLKEISGPWLYNGSENIFKGLNLIDRVPEELWAEVHDIVQEAGIKTIPKKKKCKKAKWFSEEVLQIAVKRS